MPAAKRIRKSRKEIDARLPACGPKFSSNPHPSIGLHAQHNQASPSASPPYFSNSKTITPFPPTHPIQPNPNTPTEPSVSEPQNHRHEKAKPRSRPRPKPKPKPKSNPNPSPKTSPNQSESTEDQSKPATRHVTSDQVGKLSFKGVTSNKR